MYGWGGEIVGINASLEAGRAKLIAARRSADKPRTNLTDLGIPAIRTAEAL